MLAARCAWKWQAKMARSCRYLRKCCASNATPGIRWRHCNCWARQTNGRDSSGNRPRHGFLLRRFRWKMKTTRKRTTTSPTEGSFPMSTPDAVLPDHERRKYPRYYVNTRLTLAIEDESLKESIGLGEPADISLGGLRVCNLPACPNVRVGDQLGLLLIDQEEALSLRGEVVHHATPDTFGVEFRRVTPNDQQAVGSIIARLYT
ncbi:MAG TPA: hypothetical protein DC047_11895 [Blastocatellia bacterium]|nr:hypothetical protein [Blastocatellia bacterium]